ncbi:MAG: hypothetical protein OEU84_04290 [Xanthomonadales bacterium]|jgi:hypothetical protein|nr:hypothetical protein [Xanthomonadales bacterium]
MELMQWFFMGVLFTIGVFGLSYLSLKVKLKWYTWACLITGIIAILFGIGWAGGSFLEGVAQSGAMGLIIFSGGGLILLLLTWRYLVAPELEPEGS